MRTNGLRRSRYVLRPFVPIRTPRATAPTTNPSTTAKGEFTFDFENAGRLLGVEVKFASQGLPADFLDAADPI